MKTRLLSVGIIAAMIFFTACEKGSGRGGTSTIKGTVWVDEYNGDFTLIRDSYLGAKEDVFIIYGDDEVYGDKFETNFDGTYEFKYLREGSYTVFAYSKDSTLDYNITSQKKAIMHKVEITAKDQTIEVPVIRVLK